MIQKISNFLKTDFFKNVSILAFGSILGQAFMLCISPILTRLFSPDNFGTLATFSSLISILATFSTGKYEFAIILPKKEEDALGVVALCIFISFIFSSTLFLLSFIFKDFVTALPFFTGGTFWIIFIPFCIFFVGINTALSYWLLRKEDYKNQSIYLLGYNLLNGVSSLIFGYIGFNYWGLEVSVVIATLCSVFVLSYLLRKSNIWLELYKSVKNTDIKAFAKRYIDFPKFYILTQFLTNLVQQITPLLFATLFTSSIVGFYALANRVLRLPVIVLSNSISGVFRNDALKEIKQLGNARLLYKRTFKKLVILSLPIFVLLFFILPILFKIVFGPEWHQAGVFAQLMCLMVFFDFISSPIAQSIFIIREAQKTNLIIQAIGAVLAVLGIYLGALWFGSVHYSIVFFSIASIFYNLLGLYASYKIA